MIVGDALLEAVQDRWRGRGVAQQITNGVTLGQPLERTDVPYAIIDGLSEAKKTDTSTSRLRRVMFTVNVYQKPSEEALRLMRIASEALTFAPLVLRTGQVLLVEDGNAKLLEEDYFSHATQDFVATVQRTANYSPG
jgi:hypothetical protein